MKLHHKTPVSELFARMRVKLTAVFHNELRLLGTTFETATEDQKKVAFLKMDQLGLQMLKQIDYFNHPEIKNL
jgi:hypothetical protein